MTQPNTPAGMQVHGRITPEFAQILTPEALTFLGKLHRQFNNRRLELLARRAQRQKELDTGKLPDFLAETRDVREAQWQELLDRCLKRAGKSTSESASERKSAPWKVAIAAFMKQKTQVTNRWLCDRLSMGTPVAVSHHVGQLRRNKGPAHRLLETLTLNIKT